MDGGTFRLPPRNVIAMLRRCILAGSSIPAVRVPLKAVLWLTIAVGHRGAVDARDGQLRQRAIRWNPTKSLAEVLQPDDELVVVGRNLDYFEPDRPLTVKDVIEDASVRADLVAVVDVDAVEPVEISGWIYARLTGTIREVLRVSKDHHYRAGERQSAHVPGGELQIGHVLVRALDNELTAVPHLPYRRSYLVFLLDTEGRLYPTHVPLLIEGGKLTYPYTFNYPQQPRNPMEGLTVPDVARTAREARTSWLSEGKPRQ
jgi:hypothetical protein